MPRSSPLPAQPIDPPPPPPPALPAKSPPPIQRLSSSSDFKPPIPAHATNQEASATTMSDGDEVINDARPPPPDSWTRLFDELNDQYLAFTEATDALPHPSDSQRTLLQLASHAMGALVAFVRFETSARMQAQVPSLASGRGDTLANVERLYSAYVEKDLVESMRAFYAMVADVVTDCGSVAKKVKERADANHELFTKVRNFAETVRRNIPSLASIDEITPLSTLDHQLPSKICVGGPDFVFDLKSTLESKNLPLLCSLLAHPTWGAAIDKTSSDFPFFDLNHRFLEYQAKMNHDPANGAPLPGSPYRLLHLNKKRRIDPDRTDGRPPPIATYPLDLLEKFQDRFGHEADVTVHPSDLSARIEGLNLPPGLRSAIVRTIPLDLLNKEVVPTLIFDSQHDPPGVFGERVWGQEHVVVFVQGKKGSYYAGYLSECPSPATAQIGLTPDIEPTSSRVCQPQYGSVPDAFIIEHRSDGEMVQFSSVEDNGKFLCTLPEQYPQDTRAICFGKCGFFLSFDHRRESSSQSFSCNHRLCRTAASVRTWEGQDPSKNNGLEAHVIDDSGARTGEEVTFTHKQHQSRNTAGEPIRVVVFRLQPPASSREELEENPHPTQHPVYDFFAEIEEGLDSLTERTPVDWEENHGHAETVVLAPTLAENVPAPSKRPQNRPSNARLFVAARKANECSQSASFRLAFYTKLSLRVGRLCLYSATSHLEGGKLALVNVGTETYMTAKATLTTVPSKIDDAIRYHDGHFVDAAATVQVDDDLNDTPATLASQFKEHPGYNKVTLVGRERIANHADQLFVSEHILDPSGKPLDDLWRSIDDPPGPGPEDLNWYKGIAEDLQILKAFLNIVRIQSSYLRVTLDESIDPIAFEILLDHMRLVRLFRSGFEDPGPLNLQSIAPAETRAAVKLAMDKLGIVGHVY